MLMISGELARVIERLWWKQRLSGAIDPDATRLHHGYDYIRVCVPTCLSVTTILLEHFLGYFIRLLAFDKRYASESTVSQPRFYQLAGRNEG